MSDDQGRSPVRRLPDGMLEVALPSWATDFLADAAGRLQATAQEPGTPAFKRLFGRADSAASVEDPLVVLTRQTMVDDIVATVRQSARKRLISEEEGEAWLKVLGLSLAARAADLDIQTDEARDALPLEEAQYFDVVHALQIFLIEALDA